LHIVGHFPSAFAQHHTIILMTYQSKVWTEDVRQGAKVVRQLKDGHQAIGFLVRTCIGNTCLRLATFQVQMLAIHCLSVGETAGECA
jgi:hypothetical protein